MKRTPDGAGHIREAIRRLTSRGVEPSVPKIRGELLRWRGVGASFRDVQPVYVAWRESELARRAGIIEAAADAILLLGTTMERQAVARIVEARSGGGVRIKFTVKARNTGGGHRKRGHTPLHTVHGS
jgi:hypothetical protein